jgi:phosphatidylglycerophosphatase A
LFRSFQVGHFKSQIRYLKLPMNRPLPIKVECTRPLDRTAYFVATGAGAGLAPIAPGTLGAMEAVGIYFLMTAFSPAPAAALIFLAACGLASFAAGVWAAGRTCRLCGIDDPSQIVIDEINGQLIALTPLAVAPSVAGVIAAFALFRLFDIFKPYPIGKLESLHGGLGVMADDALAGLYAAALVGLAIRWELL